jgi:hypothetical protein
MAGVQTPEEEAALRRRAAQVNANQNNQRVSRMEEIARNADARRARELDDTDGETSTGRFADGELDDSPEARERQAELDDLAAEEALQEERIAAAKAIEDEQARARELQTEGAGDGEGGGTGEREQLNQAGDEKTVGGVKYYLTIVNGKEKWLTLEQLRNAAQKTDAADVALQRAQDALKQATQLALQPKDTPSEISEGDLEDVIASAALGDSEAVKKLASAIKARPSTQTPVDVSRQVSEQLATQRAIDTAEREQAEILQHATLGRYFRMRLGQLAHDEPDLQIVDAYRKIGNEIRQEFAPMLKGKALPSKEERKRTLVNPPRAASRATRTEEDDDQEESPSAIADRMAKARGQQRAIRHGRVPS